MTIAEYRKQTGKELTLSSGLKVRIRALMVSDFIELGEIPSAFLKGDVAGSQEQIQKNPKLFDGLVKCVMLNCVTLVDGGKIVDKHVGECGENELSYREIPQTDLSVIISNATSNSIPSKEAGQKAQSFPTE